MLLPVSKPIYYFNGIRAADLMHYYIIYQSNIEYLAPKRSDVFLSLQVLVAGSIWMCAYVRVLRLTKAKAGLCGFVVRQ